MQLTNVRIRNYRCIRDISIDLDETTVLIGENNSGKTAFLHAIRACLGDLRSRSTRLFHEYDYHLPDHESSPTDSAPIEIELWFSEPEPDSWSEEFIQEVNDIAVTDSTDRYLIRFRLTSVYDQQAEDFSIEWDFLDADGNPLAGSARAAAHLATLQRMAPVFYLPALRAATSHFGNRGQFWRSFLSASGIPEEERKGFEQAFSELNDRLIAAHGPLNEVRSQLGDARKVMHFGAGDTVTVDALPTKLFSLLSRTQVSLNSPSGAKIPVDRQGEGMQSLAVLLLFGAFLRSRQVELDALANPITALEEPEAHLHPSAIRALMQVVSELPGQKLVSSHSGDLLASVDILSIRRFVRANGDISVHRIEPGSLTQDEARKFDFHVRRSRGELLFARCWLLVEGETETVLFTGAAEALDYDLEREGVRCVEYAQTDVGILVKVAGQLRIEWYCVADDDRGGRNSANAIQRQRGDTDGRLTVPYLNVERFLCDSGFGDIYVSRMSPQKRRPSTSPGTPEYWQQVLSALPKGYSKPGAALEAVLRMKAKKTPVPDLLRSILDRAIDFARKRQ